LRSDRALIDGAAAERAAIRSAHTSFNPVPIRTIGVTLGAAGKWR